jgi:imidazolonepropionase-like amidohydrolase
LDITPQGSAWLVRIVRSRVEDAEAGIRVAATAPEILKWASYDMAAYVGQDDEFGSIEVGITKLRKK